MTPGPLRRILGLARRAAGDPLRGYPADDAGLLARFAASADADAFELLVWRHGGMVLGVARRILGDAHAAEDVFQATFLALARRAGSVRRGGCVAAWLHRVARRVAMRARLRGERGVPTKWVVVSPTCLENSEHVGLTPRRSPSEDPVAAAARHELSEVLDEELDRLPERFRRAVVLCYLEGRSTAEAAERLGCPRGTVLSRLATAREKLRVRLVRRGLAPAAGGLAVLTASASAPASLVAPTVRAAVANTAAPGVIDLCDGVLRAMILSKLKLTTAVVLTVGLIGGGAGWVVLTPVGPGVVLAGPQVKPADNVDPIQEQQRRSEELAKRLHDELEKAQERMAYEEEQWAKERIEARLKLVEAETRLKQIERALSPENRDTRELLEAQGEFAAIATRINEILVRLADGEKNPMVEQLMPKRQAAQDKVRQAEMRLEKRYAELNDRILPTRREMMVAEERLSLLDRLTALKRRAAQAQVEDLQDRLAHLRGAESRPDPVERKVKDLERKLDDVLRELTELRRDLRK